MLLAGAFTVVAFDALASVGSLRLGFPYTRAVVGSWLIYAAVGFFAGRTDGDLFVAAMAGVVMGMVDATAGWAVSWYLGPGRVPGGALSVGRWAGAALLVAVGAGCVGLLGGVLARLVAGRGAPA